MIEVGDGNAARDPVAVQLGNARERALNAVKDAADEPRRKFDGERHARTLHNLAGAKAARLLVDLDGRPVAAQLDDLADEPLVADAHNVVHSAFRHILRHDERSGYLYDFTLHCSLRPNFSLRG